MVTLQRAMEAHNCQVAKIKETRRRRERKNRFGALKILNTELNTAVETALNEYNKKDMEQQFHFPPIAEDIGKFVADCTKCRPVQLVFSSPTQHRNNFLKFSEDFRL